MFLKWDIKVKIRLCRNTLFYFISFLRTLITELSRDYDAFIFIGARRQHNTFLFYCFAEARGDDRKKNRREERIFEREWMREGERETRRILLLLGLCLSRLIGRVVFLFVSALFSNIALLISYLRLYTGSRSSSRKLLFTCSEATYLKIKFILFIVETRISYKMCSFLNYLVYLSVRRLLA